MKEKTGRIEYLDAIKGISIMLVVFCHIPLMPNETVVGNLFMALIAVCVGQHTMGIFYIHFFMLSFCNQFFFNRITAYYSFGLNVLKTLVLKKIPVIRKLVS